MKKKDLKIYGKELILDLYNCDLEIISSKKKIQEFSDKLCQLIKMKKYGRAIIERFGLGKDFTSGFSLVQLIETSSIVGHFSEKWKRGYINIFSCQDFNEKKALRFIKKFFKAKEVKKRILIR
jgi:S-adenosylmethionine/arginine decarboxylase-like enzyme